MIFFDNNATTKIAPKVLQEMSKAFALPLNASSVHGYGRIATKFADAAREEIKKSLNAENYEVIFTSSATESNNTILNGVDTKNIFLSALEHSSIGNFKSENKKISHISVLKNGAIDLEDLQKNLPENGDFLTCLTFANNESGAIQPVKDAGKITHQKGGLFFCDLAQGMGKIKIDLEDINADFASISAHKFGGPQGVGAILYRKNLHLKPLLFGGGQEKSKRAGSLNIAGIVGLGMACQLADSRIKQNAEIAKLRDFLESEMQKITGENICFFAKEISRLPNTSFFALKNRDAQTGLINFDLNQICVSAGSACSSGAIKESPLLKAMQVEKEFLGAIRISLSPENTKAEIEKFLSVFNEFYNRS